MTLVVSVCARLLSSFMIVQVRSHSMLRWVEELSAGNLVKDVRPSKAF